MAGKRSFKSWNIFDSALIKNANGHHYWETKGFVDELLRRGESVRLFSHKHAPGGDEFPGVEIIPVFSLFLYFSVSDDPRWRKLENFIVHNRQFCEDLSGLDPALFEQSIALFPTIGDGQLLGLVRWLKSFPEDRAPKTVASLHPPAEWSATDHTVGLYKTVWQDCPPEIKRRLAIFSRTPQNAIMLESHTGMPARAFPYPIPQDIAEAGFHAPQSASDGMVVSFVGGSRRHRGGELIPDVVKQCAESGVRFFIQVRQGGDSDVDHTMLTALSSLPHVRVHEGPLERQDYYREIAKSVVLLAYMPREYRWRDSGVYHEARFLDAPVLVTAGTWMADEVASFGNGLIIEDFSADAIVNCILRAQRELPALKAAAVRVGQAEREQHGAGHCIDTIAEAFQAV